MKNLRHKVQINIADSNGNKQGVLSSTSMSIPKKLISLIFGDFCEVLVLTPGKSVDGIEIKEIGAMRERCNEIGGVRNAGK